MSTYAIADAIEKLAKNFKEAVSEKNKIERERLEFEKEKYEFSKQRLKPTTSGEFGYKYETPCNHDWRFECHIVNIDGFAERHRCAKCGEVKTMKVEAL